MDGWMNCSGTCSGVDVWIDEMHVLVFVMCLIN